MTDVDELRRVLDRYAATVPDGAGVVEAARAIRRRRRRRRTVAGITAALALAAATPVVIGHLGRPAPGTPALAPSAPAYRQPMDMTVGLDPVRPEMRLEHGVWPHGQFIVVQSVPVAGVPVGDVLVYDPGALDTKPFLAGEKVQVRGHAAYYVRTFSGGTSGGDALGWPDPSGAWAVVAGRAGAGADRLITLAEMVRLGVPGHAVTPYHLSYLPPGLEVTSVLVRDSARSQNLSVLALGGPSPTNLPEIRAATTRGAALTIEADPRSAGAGPGRGRANTQVAGHEARWYTAADPGELRLTGDRGALLVTIGTCDLRLFVDDVNKHPLEELKRIVEGASVRHCGDGATWVAPFD